MQQIGKLLILSGAVLAALGGLMLVAEKYHLFRFGRLPGDIVFRRGNFTFYFPIATSIILSILLTVVLWLFMRR